MSEPSSPDIVAELDLWLARLRDDHLPDDPDYAMMERARDEIVALRDMVEKQRFVLSKGHAEVRAEVLEEAALAIMSIPRDKEILQYCADVIRALKD